MLSTQFVRTKTGTGTATSYQQKQDFDSLFLSLSGLNLTAATAREDEDPGVLSSCLFPSAQHVVFGHSSFFKRNPGYNDLPLPIDIRSEAIRQNAGTHQRVGAVTHVAIPSIGLLVKYGPAVQISEAKTLLTLRRLLPQDVPVPEVFGWRKDGNDNFIYMSLPEGVNLAEGWAMLSENQKTDIGGQLRHIVKSWRRLRQNNSTRTKVERIDGTPVFDENLNACPPPSTFPNVAAFHEFFVTTAMESSSTQHGNRVARSYHFQPNSFFRDDTPVVFTHGNFHPKNILISTGPNPRVVAIMDWGQAGWYPAYWEFCKARQAAAQGRMASDWESTYLSWILDDEVVGIKQWGGTALCHYWDYFVGLLERGSNVGV
ncbi:kinase-like domain-containing protein [Podospora aff. communis PSN243]|uniref:Kinase-like domain-containing protein n=1 Tax=Podospora aff. communis PSN243 TaxID=3040156 RepID=A0AAV9G0V2_9PEZI|nr:kinase-like domain-containing protein [Podospora aff. communis PSN243]